MPFSWESSFQLANSFFFRAVETSNQILLWYDHDSYCSPSLYHHDTMIMILQLCPNVCLVPTFFSRTSLRYSEGLCFLAAKIGGWNLTPALCDWKVESRCVPERMSIWFWESKLNLNDCLGLTENWEPQMLTNRD